VGLLSFAGLRSFVDILPLRRDGLEERAAFGPARVRDKPQRAMSGSRFTRPMCSAVAHVTFA
jgi:hypothetical protein